MSPSEIRSPFVERARPRFASRLVFSDAASQREHHEQRCFHALPRRDRLRHPGNHHATAPVRPSAPTTAPCSARVFRPLAREKWKAAQQAPSANPALRVARDRAKRRSSLLLVDQRLKIKIVPLPSTKRLSHDAARLSIGNGNTGAPRPLQTAARPATEWSPAPAPSRPLSSDRPPALAVAQAPVTIARRQVSASSATPHANHPVPDSVPSAETSPPATVPT